MLSLQVPCLLMTGDADKVVRPWFVEAEVRPWLPNIKPLRLLAGGNHLGCLAASAADRWVRQSS